MKLMTKRNINMKIRCDFFFLHIYGDLIFQVIVKSGITFSLDMSLQQQPL